MKSTATALLCLSAPAAVLAKLGDGTRPAVDGKIYDILRRRGAGAPAWQAREPWLNKFRDYSLAEVKALMGTRDLPRPKGATIPDVWETSGAGTLPESFDARQKFSSCSQAIRNQLHCGSCWAVAAAETLSENLCVAGEIDGGVNLSAQDLVSCDTVDHGCHGGTLPSAWQYLDNTGIVDNACMPYTAGNGTVDMCKVGLCPASPGMDWTKHKCKKSNMLSDANDIRNGVLQYGSAEAGFYVYEDFLHYKSGVYKHDNSTGGRVLGGHAVRIVGWGTDAVAGKYWLVANSWGTDWGEDGYFKIALSDTDSAFAMGGAFNCGELKPAPPPPTPPAPSPTCGDVLPSAQCAKFKDSCAKGIWNECKETCGCCSAFNKPDFCGSEYRSPLSRVVQNAVKFGF